MKKYAYAWLMVFALGAGAQEADTIYVNGIVLTMGRQNTVQQAVAVLGDKILATGNNEEMLWRQGPSTRVVDLEGRVMMPGFVDAHGHFPLAGANDLYTADLSAPPVGTVDAMAALLTKLRERAKRTPNGEWVIGMNYDDTLLEERRHPTRRDLDLVSREHPVFVFHSSLHIAAANSLALQLAGITKDTPQPEGGLIWKSEESGEPTGVLEEIPAFGQVYFKIPARSVGQEVDAVNHAAWMYARQGVTTAQNSYAQPNDLKALAAAVAQDRLPIRVVAMPPFELAMQEIEGELELDRSLEPWVYIGAAKIIQDGSIQGYTGYLTQPYHTAYRGDDSYRGYPARSREKLAEIVGTLHEAGWQVGIHANGDAAIDDAISAWRTAQEASPRNDARPFIIHAQMTREDQLAVFEELGMIPSFFVLHTYYWGDRHRDVFLGPERAARISPTRSALERGLRFTIHCDTPVVPMEPLRLVWSAVNRKTVNGQLLGADQRVSVLDALRATTIEAAHQHFLEDKIGSIEAGKFADLVILEQDPRVFPTRLHQIEVLETIVGGRTVYRKEQGA